MGREDVHEGKFLCSADICIEIRDGESLIDKLGSFEEMAEAIDCLQPSQVRSKEPDVKIRAEKLFNECLMH